MNMRRIMLSALMMLVGMASLAGEKLTIQAGLYAGRASDGRR